MKGLGARVPKTLFLSRSCVIASQRRESTTYGISSHVFIGEPPWWDAAWATWALVIVGLGGTIAAIWTLLTIRRQTTAIERQVREM